MSLQDTTNGRSHPLKPFRLRLTCELITAYGLLSLPDTRFIETRMAGDEDLLLFHNRDYIEILKASNRGVSVPVVIRGSIPEDRIGESRHLFL